jgi:hypothetical protein
VDKITACDRETGPPRPDVRRAWPQLNWQDEFCGVYPKMYDVYRHLKLTPYRAIIPKDAPFPSERHAQNWRKVGTLQGVSPETKKQIDQKGFCIYIFTPTLSFDEVEGANSNIERDLN